jgi:V/A-type H+-transporting ATPase subunit I
MIVEMSRVLVVGPKRHLAAVLEALQGVGSLHVDRIEAEEAPEEFSRLAPDSAGRAQVDALERLRARADGLLTLLPSAPVDPVPATAEFAAKSPEDLEADLAALEEQVQPLVRRRLELQDEMELVRSYESAVRVLSPLLGALAGSHSLETVGFILRARDLAIVQDLRRRLVELTGGRVEVVSRVVEEGKVGVVAAFHRRDAEAVHGFLARAGIGELRLPSAYADLPPAQAIRKMEERRTALPGEIGAVGAALQQIAAAGRSRLVALRAVLLDRLTQFRVMPQLAQSRYTFVVHGWTPTRTVTDVRRSLQKRFGAEVVVYDTPADPHEAERVPVLLDNPGPIRPFQMLLGLFPPPRYGTWDPSPLIAVTFPLFVGLVIGDVGYGLLFFLLGWRLRNRARAGQSLPGSTPRGFLDWVMGLLGFQLDSRTVAAVSWLIRVMALWVIGFGVVYGEFFGNLPELFFQYHPIFDRVTNQANQTRYFYAIILTGIGMVYLGLVGHLAMAIRHRHAEGIFESLVTIFTLTAILVFLGTFAQLLPGALARWSLYFALGAVGAAIASRKPMSLMWFLESFTALGHVLSHARLLAFGIAAAALALAANQLGEQMAAGGGILGYAVGVLIGGVAQALFFIFTIIGHIIQPARLHWVEFLTKVKYHDETGREYRPFQKAGGGQLAEGR